jgi:ABC-type transport system substrate-binding protein
VPILDGVDLPIITDQGQAEAQFRARNVHGGPGLGGPAVSETNILPFSRDLKDTRIDLMPQNVLGPTIAFGYRDNMFKDVRVRQAVSMLIDRDTFIEVFTNYKAFQAAGIKMTPKWATPLSAAWGPYWLDPKDSKFGASARNYKLDVAEAKKLLAAAGHANGFETPFTFISGAQWGRDWSQRAEALMSMLAKGGIRAKANSVDYNSVFIPQYLRSAGDFQGLAMQRTGSRGDPGQFWSVFFSSTGGSSQVGKQFPELDELINKQRRETDMARRVAANHDLQRYFAENMPAAPMGGHVEEPVLTWKGLKGPDGHFIWPGGDLGAEAYPAYSLDASLRG